MKNIGKINNKKLSEISLIFSRDDKIIAGYLFGSLAKGDFHQKSDIDLAIMIDPSRIRDFSLDERLSLEVDLTLFLETENFDLVVINRAPLVLQFRIISGGKVIYKKDDDLYTSVEEIIMERYYDFLPALRKFNKEYFEALEEKYLNGRQRKA